MWLGFREPQSRRRRDMRAFPILLGMARHLAVGRLSIEHCAFHNACNDVFTNRSRCICR